MGLLSRWRPEPATDSEDVAARPGAKGRPTPKRSEARAQRAKTTSTSGPGKRGSSGDGRSERRSKAAEYRVAMRSTDPRQLPERERVPERIIARDVVDSRPTAGPLFFLVVVADFVSEIHKSTVLTYDLALAFYSVLVVVLLDWGILCWQARRAIRARVEFPTNKVHFYIFMRALLPRRFRRPPARPARPRPPG
jgi:hypothetical protein